MTDRARAERLDANDPLASFRDRFAIDDPETIYLDGNSLGRLPLATRERLSELTAQWGSELVGGWHDWIDLPERVGDLLASGVLGARPGEVIVADSTTVNLFKLAGAVLDTRPGAIVTDSENFPTDRYVLDGLARLHGRELRIFEADPLNGPQPEDVERACEAGGVALVSLSHVAYRSGALADMERIAQAAAPAPVIWDLSHSAGAVPIELEQRGVELAVGCTYKYLNAGPGAPAFLYVRDELQERLRTPIQGWFGQRDQFQMERPYDPAPGVRGFLAGTPPILALGGCRGGREADRRGGHPEAARQGSGAHRADRRDPRRAPRSAWLPAGNPTRPGPARRAREPRARRGLADLPRAHRARQGHPGLPRTGLDPPRRAAALHPLRRCLRRARAPGRPSSSAASTARSTAGRCG